MPSDPTKSGLLGQLRRAAEVQVQRDIADVEIIHLSGDASERFAAALIKPPPVNQALKRAFAH